MTFDTKVLHSTFQGAVVGLLAGQGVSLWLLLPPILSPPPSPKPALNTIPVLQLVHSLPPHLVPPVGFLTSLLLGLVLSLLPSSRPPPRLLLHPWARPPPHTGPSSDPPGAWNEGSAHYRWPSPSLPPTLKRPRPSTLSLPRPKGPHKTSFYVGGPDNFSAGSGYQSYVSSDYRGGGQDNDSYSDWGDDWGPTNNSASHSRL